MCLAVPGRILSLEGETSLESRGEVDFEGILREVNLSFVPDAKPGDWVLVHAGFALQMIDDAEARRTLEELRMLHGQGGDTG